MKQWLEHGKPWIYQWLGTRLNQSQSVTGTIRFRAPPHTLSE